MITPRHRFKKNSPVSDRHPAKVMTPTLKTPLATKRPSPPALVCTRYMFLPLACVAVWFHEAIGMAFSIALIVALWFWLDAIGRMLPIKSGASSWLSKASFGEMVLMNRPVVEVPETDLKTARVFWGVATVSGITGLLAAYFHAPLILGSSIVVFMAARTAYLSRMADLYSRMQFAHPLYRFWSINPQNDNAPSKARRKSA